MGDIHGCHKGLKQCLERSNFDKEKDVLIQLGDVVDGWNDVYECVEELLTIKKLIPIRGNHDDWFKTWLIFGEHPCRWLQGGIGTLKSYLRNCLNDENAYVQNSGAYMSKLTNVDIPASHIDFFTKKQISYFVQNDSLFVHGGFNRHFYIDDAIYNSEEILMWDRDLWMSAMSYGSISIGKPYKFKMKDNFKEVFIGHTDTMNWDKDIPMHKANIWNLDTGGGFSGKVTIMDINTKEYWQSDKVTELYPNQRGRN